jgi:hypothetical protein
MSVSREKLYEEVWAEPMTTVARRYSISSNFLARVCARLRIPSPARGYWAQLAAGQSLPRPALPDARPGDEIEWSRDSEPRRVPRELPVPPADPASIRSRRRKDRPEQHELLIGARSHFEGAKESDGYLRPLKKILIDVFVSKESLDRALDVANELFLAFEDRGHRVVFAPHDWLYQRPDLDERAGGGAQRYYPSRWRPSCPTVVFVGTVAFGLTLFELSEEVEVEYVDGRYVRVSPSPAPTRRRSQSPQRWTHTRDMPSGKLSLRASSPYPRASWEKQWRESHPGDLAAKFSQIFRCLETEASTIAKMVEDGERQARIEQQRAEEQYLRWKLEEEERRRAQNLKDSRQELFAIIEAWGEAKRIEAFFEDVERRATNLDEDDHLQVRQRAQLARSMLGGTDALDRLRTWKAPYQR